MMATQKQSMRAAATDLGTFSEWRRPHSPGRGVTAGAGSARTWARVAAGSVALAPAPHNKSVAGVPARIVGEAGCAEPARDMNQILAEKGIEA